MHTPLIEVPTKMKLLLAGSLRTKFCPN